MPYIKSNDDRRKLLQNDDVALSAGELNYQIFYYMKHGGIRNVSKVSYFIKRFLGAKPNYQKYNDAIGVMILCYKELYRRLKIDASFLIDLIDEYDQEIAIYEDFKIIENGDVE